MQCVVFQYCYKEQLGREKDRILCNIRSLTSIPKSNINLDNKPLIYVAIQLYLLFCILFHTLFSTHFERRCSHIYSFLLPIQTIKVTNSDTAAG